MDLGREPNPTDAQHAIAFWKAQVEAGYSDVLRAFDYSGLGMYFLQNLKGLASGDMSANTMYGNCQRLEKSGLQRGDWVFRTNAHKAYHIGYIVDEALNVIEAEGRKYGCVKRPLDAQEKYWNAYGRPKWFADEIESAILPPTPPPSDEQPGATILVLGHSVNIRNTSPSSSEALGIAYAGERYAYVQTMPNGWYQIKYQGDTLAYISGRTDLTRLETTQA